MDKKTFAAIEAYMLSVMNDGAHDRQHVYRVLYAALDIAADRDIDVDALIAAALLHDIGREAQFRDPALDHADVGADLAYRFLIDLGWPEVKARLVEACIRSHRFRGDAEPANLEAMILFDADKLDVTGAIGIARTLAYKGIVAEPLYSLDAAGAVLDGSVESGPSFFQEYHFKLKRVYGQFYTEQARAIAADRRASAAAFYESLLSEVGDAHGRGRDRLNRLLRSDD